ncbi:hypothetical protein ECE50_026505 [Chitinophaga sp. Mgbs1]|uniref:Uncharacterized protein n=1 Tax=Chitinophaga solisilvae TaxID=1233460 RepID=A0A3S1BJ31_9BACT|nr:hypothetical protein [Chitinophaga solisilvae]
MPVKKIAPVITVFCYHPRFHEFYVAADLKFYYNRHTGSFEMDHHPHSDPFPVPVELHNTADAGILQFDTVYRGQQTTYELTALHPWDIVIFNLIREISHTDFTFHDDDKDKIELIFEEGDLSKIYFYKHEDDQLIDSLRIVRYEGSLHLVRQRPFTRIPLKGLQLEGNQLLAHTATEIIPYTLHTQPFILGIMKQLLENIQLSSV